MNFYATNEETPLLRSIQMATSPARSESETNSPSLASSGSSSMYSQSNRLHNQTEVQLSVDKVSFIYSPKSPNSSSFHAASSEYNDDELSILDPYFDVTSARLIMAFEEGHPNDNRQLSYDGFKVALESMGIRCADDAAFLKLVQSIDRQGAMNVSFEQFDAAVHKLKLVHLFEDSVVQRMIPMGYKPATITVSDFSNTRLQQFAIRYTDFPEFCTTTRPSWVSVRWINLNGRDTLSLKRLAIKYRLHPLAIEDTLEMHERPKFDRYDGHLFLVFPVLRMEMIQDKLPSKRKRSRSNSISNMLKLDKHTNPSKRIEEPYEDPFKLWIEHIAIFVVGDTTVITVKDGDQSHMWQELNRRLTIPYSKLRHNNAKFLTYAVLDVIVDQIIHVIDSITENLMELEDQLERLKHHFDIGSLRVLKNELFRLPRLLKPAREVLKNLIDSKDFDETATAYIRDVHDHTVQVLDDIELQLQMCRLLTEDYRDAKSNQMNYVIYTLTITTTIFLPAQFLTGVYGMNFDNMPELHNRYGYPLFWVCVLSIAIGLQTYFRYKKWV